MSRLFISDLHLDPSRPAIVACFLQLLKQQAGKAESLYILGDLFEAWIGDDDPELLWREVIQAISRCVDAGTPVFVMHGNRDFLLGERFLHDSACRLIDDPTLINLYGQRILLMHGDLLCSDDTEYQALRKQVRDPAWQEQVLAHPVSRRRDMARQAREQSQSSILGKSDDIMDVNPQPVEHYMQTYQADLLVHGHTHRPGIHTQEDSGRTTQRIVLGDWYRHGHVLLIDDKGVELRKLPTRSYGDPTMSGC